MEAQLLQKEQELQGKQEAQEPVQSTQSEADGAKADGAKADVADYKKKEVAEFVELINKYSIIGMVNFESLPAAQLQNMRELLRDKVELRMTKKRFMKIALEQSNKPETAKLMALVRGMPALLFTNENPFSLYATIKRNKSSAPAKAGQTAPNDIKVSAGATPFAPGPIISELGSIGLKTAIENGKVAIKEDAVVVKEGEVIDRKTADILARLGIEPMEIGLDLIAVFEDGNIFKKDVLDIDEDEFKADLTQSWQWAFNLAFNAGYPTTENIGLMIIKCFNDSKALAVSRSIMAGGIAEDILLKAQREMLSLKNQIDK